MSSPDYETIVFDASNAIHRISAANPALTNAAGEPVEVVFGFLRLLSAVLRDNTAKECICAWDTRTSRHMRQKIDSGYKRHRVDLRSPADKARLQTMYPQVDRFWNRFGRHLPITWLESPIYEADDIMGMYAIMAERMKRKTLIVTGDKDILQCVNKYTTVHVPHSGRFVNLENFQEVTGYPTPQAFLIGKVLQGEPQGDCIPGIPGIVDKRAQKIVLDHGCNLHRIKHQPLESLTKTQWGKELAKPSSWERIELNWKLMCLSGPLHQVIRFNRIDIKIGKMNEHELRTNLAKNQFASLMVEWNRWIQPFTVLECKS
jgi:5'-3' exonuclease